MAKKTEESKKVMGRPKKTIDPVQFEELCDIHCTREEIANIFQCDENTINSWCKRTYGDTFSRCHKVFASGGKASLRRRLMTIAMDDNGKGSVTAAIWLSKNYLGMSEKLDISNNDVEPFIIQTRRGDFKLGMQKKEDKDNDTDRTVSEKTDD